MPPKKNKLKNISKNTTISNDVSSIDEEQNKNIDEEQNKNDEKKKFIERDFLEKVIKYIKTDDLIRKETLDYKEKISTLKEQKDNIETYILRYLDTIEEDQIKIEHNGKLSKYESVRKSSINRDIIKDSIYEQLKKENIISDEKKLKELVELTYDTMEKKRDVKKKVYLKRTFEKNPMKKPKKTE